MIEEQTLLAWLIRQSLLLSLGVGLVLALRPLLLRCCGAEAARHAWALPPAMLLSMALPRPAQEPGPVVWLTSASALRDATVSALHQLQVPAGDTGVRLLLAAWALGALLIAALQWRRQRRLQRLVDWQGRRRAGLLPAGASPALIGCWPGRLALPRDFEQRFDGAARRLIRGHEHQHLRQSDNAWNLLACLICTLHWFNPLAWLGWRRLRADQELACDAAVLRRHPGQRAAYARALLAAQGLTPLAAPTASPWISTTHPLIERIAMLKTHQALSARRRIGQRVAALLVLLGMGSGYIVQAEPAPSTQLVELKMTFGIEGRPWASPRLITALGVPATVEIDRGDANGAWRIVTTVTQEASGELRILSLFSDGRPRVAHEGSHTQIAKAGAPIQMHVDSVTGGPALDLKRVVTLLPARQD